MEKELKEINKSLKSIARNLDRIERNTRPEESEEESLPTVEGFRKG